MNKRKINIILIIAFLHLVNVNATAQRIGVQASRTRIFIGEQITLRLAVEQGRIGMAWFRFADTLNHLEVVSRGKIDTVAKNGYSNFYQAVTITSFDSGRWQFPAIAIAGINQVSMPVTIDVVPVDVSKKNDYNDIKDIEEVQVGTDQLIIFLLAALALLSLLIIYIFIQQKKKTATQKPILKGSETPLQWALNKLAGLPLPDDHTLANAKHYYTELNSISRTFFSMQLSENNKQLTTDEWMINLQQLNIENDYKTPFYQLLRMADSVKFAKYIPPASENNTAKDIVKNMLQKAALLHADIYLKYQPQ